MNGICSSGFTQNKDHLKVGGQNEGIYKISLRNERNPQSRLCAWQGITSYFVVMVPLLAGIPGGNKLKHI